MSPQKSRVFCVSVRQSSTTAPLAISHAKSHSLELLLRLPRPWPKLFCVFSTERVMRSARMRRRLKFLGRRKNWRVLKKLHLLNMSDLSFRHLTRAHLWKKWIYDFCSFCCSNIHIANEETGDVETTSAFYHTRHNVSCHLKKNESRVYRGECFPAILKWVLENSSVLR